MLIHHKYRMLEICCSVCGELCNSISGWIGSRPYCLAHYNEASGLSRRIAKVLEKECPEIKTIEVKEEITEKVVIFIHRRRRIVKS